MNSRERFLETICYGDPDRAPLLEEGFRKKVVQTWRRAAGLPGDFDPQIFFGFDKREEIPLELEPGINLAALAGKKNGLKKLQNLLDPDDPKRFPKKWKKKLKSWESREFILMLRVHPGFFLSLGVEDWRSFSDVTYLVKDDPEFVRQALVMHGEFAARAAEKILRRTEIDAAIFSEPIGCNFGPLISPRMYREYMLPALEPVMDTLRRYGVETIIFRTYANTRVLLPLMFEAGMTCLWAVERDMDSMDYLDIRRAFGQGLRLIGGFDRDILRMGKDHIRREFDINIPPLLEDGGFLPMLDGRIREDIPFENYLYYRRCLGELTGLPLPESFSRTE